MTTSSYKLGSNFFGLRLQIEYIHPRLLAPAERRTRKHSKLKIKKLARSIAEHGMLLPIRVNASGRVIGGHALLEAAMSINAPTVPVVRIEHLTPEQERLYAIAENKLAEGSTWDLDALRIEFEEITMSAPTLDLGRSGFEIAERDIIIGNNRTDELADLDDAVPTTAADTPVSRVGDLYQLGRHSLLCADATDPKAIAAVCRGREVRAMVSDLPYNVKISGHVSGLGSKTHREFAMASGEMTRSEFTHFVSRSIAAAKGAMAPGGLLYLFMDWRHMAELLSAAEEQALSQLNLLVWAKTNAGMGSHYRSAHELIGLFKHGDAPHVNNVLLGKHGRNRTNVLHYPGVNTFAKGRAKALDLHPTVKPVALIADLILDSSGSGDLILDSFGGSGTTLIAAEKVGRDAALVELDPGYVDTTIRRWEELTGKRAILSATGESFEALTSTRTRELEAADAA